MVNQILLAKDVSYPFPKEMQTTHHTIRTHALIVLVELHLVTYQWLYFLFKLSLAKAFKEITTSISK